MPDSSLGQVFLKPEKRITMDTKGLVEQTSSADDVYLRDVNPEDLPIFFEQQQDPAAVHMAAFTAKDPTDRAAFMAHWQRILGSPTNIMKTIVWQGQAVGNIGSYEEDGRLEVTYWIGKDYWGQGLATKALAAFLKAQTARPLYGRAAKDNAGSLRVMEKCGFTVIGSEMGYANARGGEIEELLLVLK
jgi:RimJ/RimL family protein N-acetyltransferase